jgi:serine protease AprX
MANAIAGSALDATGGRPIGVAPAATVLVVRVARPDGTSNWVGTHTNQVNVVNLSLSHRRPFPQYVADPLNAAVERLRDQGVTVVVSAGNSPGQVGDPGLDPKALTVGAADLLKQKVATFSGSATVAGVRKPDVVASGVRVLGLLPDDSVLGRSPMTVHLPGGLARGTGTSQATAVVSGLAALFLQSHPEATPLQVKASLRCAATALPGRRDGAGLVNATTRVCSTPDGRGLDGSGDVSGEGSWDASSWTASSWTASSWTASSWTASSWTASSWTASSWTADSFGDGDPSAESGDGNDGNDGNDGSGGSGGWSDSSEALE